MSQSAIAVRPDAKVWIWWVRGDTCSFVPARHYCCRVD